MALQFKERPVATNTNPGVKSWQEGRETAEINELLLKIRNADDDGILEIGFDPKSDSVKALRSKIIFAEAGNLSGVMVASGFEQEQAIQFIRRFHKLIGKAIPIEFQKEAPTTNNKVAALTRTLTERIESALAKYQ